MVQACETPNSNLSACLVMVGIYALIVPCNTPILSLQGQSLDRSKIFLRPSKKHTHTYVINITYP
jgi:hypothetical protein